MTTSAETQRYLDDLAAALALRKVDGRRAGEILAEVEAHVADSRESPRDAFGEPRAYADQFAGPPGRVSTLATVVSGIGAGVGTAAAGLGLYLALTGVSVGWLLLGLGAVVTLAVFLLTPVNPVLDPRSGSVRYGRRFRVSLGLGALTGVLIVAALLVEIVRALG